MAKLRSFVFITLNGYFTDVNNDISWHRHGEEESRYSDESLQTDTILLFGRTTYEMMYSFWPTPMASEMHPRTAEGMNSSEKIVFSNTILNPDWSNTRVINGDIIGQTEKLKNIQKKDMIILGSGSIVKQLAEAKLIDEFQIMIDPVVIGNGKSIFEGMKTRLDLELKDSRIFKSGVILLTYKPIQ